MNQKNPIVIDSKFVEKMINFQENKIINNHNPLENRRQRRERERHERRQRTNMQISNKA